MPTPTYDLIATQTTSSVVTSVTFNSIPNTYRDLVIVSNIAAPSGDSWLGLRFNGDSGNNYNWVRAGSGGSSSASGSNQPQIELYAHITTTKGLWITNVMDYQQTNKHKSAVGHGGSVGGFGVAMSAGRWASTSAITSVTLFGGQGLEFASGATFTIFGIVS